jgi:hypothetical protein
MGNSIYFYEINSLNKRFGFINLYSENEKI